MNPCAGKHVVSLANEKEWLTILGMNAFLL